APCKAAVPALVELERAGGTRVLAITDEPKEALDPYFATNPEFPGVVAVDEYRKTFLAYAVSGTPTFVLIDNDGTVLSYRTGFSPDLGLQLPVPPIPPPF
ncbi:MAG TPA: hypothetical protein VEB21_15395, partial [Terriglobales bacterium]|nr:hypothetical protein [Terriglobales bacterium]